jgi:hypothetical protein
VSGRQHTARSAVSAPGAGVLRTLDTVSIGQLIGCPRAEKWHAGVLRTLGPKATGWRSSFLRWSSAAPAGIAPGV